VIREATLSHTIVDEGMQAWLGRPWVETVGELGGERVRRMVQDARNSGVSAFGQVTQLFPSGLELPVEYTTVRLGGGSGLLAVGKNLQAVSQLQARLIAAQQAREQDYWKLREVETRYRLLFDASNEAVVLLRADTLQIVEVNPAAIRALGLDPGGQFLPELMPREREAFQTMLARARDQGRVPGILLHLGAERAPWMVRASLMASEPGAVFMLQLASAGAVKPEAPRRTGTLDRLVERLPDALVVIDREGVVQRCNPAFLDLVQAGGEGAVAGESLGRWLRQPGADLAVLLAQVARHQVVRLMPTAVHGEFGSETEVEISAAGDGGQAIAVLLRSVARRLTPAEDGNGLGSALRAVSDRLGETPLLQLVRDTTGVVERHYIEEALVRAEGNRTAAAELLGLSRQSLYMKLNRYGLAGHSATTTESE
jgi:transcriptional regulator PpsR